MLNREVVRNTLHYQLFSFRWRVRYTKKLIIREAEKDIRKIVKLLKLNK